MDQDKSNFEKFEVFFLSEEDNGKLMPLSILSAERKQFQASLKRSPSGNGAFRCHQANMTPMSIQTTLLSQQRIESIRNRNETANLVSYHECIAVVTYRMGSFIILIIQHLDYKTFRLFILSDASCGGSCIELSSWSFRHG